MKIKILKFVHGSSEKQPVPAELDTARDLSAAGAEAAPVAYVAPAKDLGHFRKLKDQVVDRGAKHKAKGLSKLLLGQKKVPIIDGGFSDPGQLRRSVRTLLANAESRGERNVYIIGAGESIFELLWERANEARAGGESRAPDKTDTGARKASPGTDRLETGGDNSRVLLQMLGDCAVSPKLAHRFKGSSVEAQLVRLFAMRAAQSDVRVLVLGDTGTGKEVVARAIHDLSRRAGAPFTPVNCGGIPRELLESELFGHEKGAFTGAVSRKTGLWKVADKGTLFLDEIGDLPMEHQAKILRALEEGEIRPVGGNKAIPVDARIIAATNRDLYAMVAASQFREDLYYRLREFMIRTPALRERPGDIPVLARHVWGKIVKDGSKTLPEEVLEALQSYGWMGNVRELRTVLTYLHSLFGEEKVSVEGLKAIFQFYGQTLVLPRDRKTADAPGPKRVEGLSHLRRVDEIMKACEATLRPVMEHHPKEMESIAAVQKSLGLRLHELETLCLNPLRFESESLFSMVNLFKGKLAYLQGLLRKDAGEAVQFWEAEGSGVLSQVHSAVSMEISGLLTDAP